MKKLLLLAGAAIGFVLGSRAGREPYNRLKRKAREVGRRPEVKHAVDSVTQVVHENVNGLADQVAAKVPSRTAAKANGAA
jgi:hypothetical protein